PGLSPPRGRATGAPPGRIRSPARWVSPPRSRKGPGPKLIGHASGAGRRRYLPFAPWGFPSNGHGTGHPRSGPKRQTVSRQVEGFHLAEFVLRDVDPFSAGPRESHVGGEFAGGLNTLDNLAILTQHGNVALAEDRDIQPAIGCEGHAVRSSPTRGCIRPDHVSKQNARAANLAVLAIVTINVAGQRLISIQQEVRAKGNAVGEFDAAIQLLHLAGLHIDAIHTPVIPDV